MYPKKYRILKSIQKKVELYSLIQYDIFLKFAGKLNNIMYIMFFYT